MKQMMTTMIAVGFLAAAQPALAQQQSNVVFARGQSSATLNGRIQGDGDYRYIVNARAGQTLTVTFKPNNTSAYFNVTAPGADSAMFIGSTSGNRFSGPVTVTGPHVVQVYLMRSAARRGATAAYTITIGVAGRGAAAAPRPSRDALVAGTKFNATADIPCVASAGAPRGSCKAGVTRLGMGEATVAIQTPDGGTRNIYFKDGRPTGSDARAAFQATRRGDWNIIRIGTVELYEIPDAFVVGG
jgi:hypothetical protein